MTYYYISGKLSKFLALSAVLGLCSFGTHNKQVEGLIYEDASVTVVSAISQCILPKNGTENFNAMLTVKNKTGKKIAVSYSRELYYDDQCVSCGSAESRFTLEIDANSARSADCESTENNGLRIFHHMPSGLTKARLTDIRLKDVTVKIIQ